MGATGATDDKGFIAGMLALTAPLELSGGANCTAGGVVKPGIMVMEISGGATSGVADGSVNQASLAEVTTSTVGA